MHSPRLERKQRESFSVKWKQVRIPATALGGVMLVTLLGLYLYACSYVYLQPSLPTREQMRNVELKVPLRIYTSTGDLIAQIGAQQRTPVRYDQIPPLVRNAFLAAEDHRFFQESGISFLSIARAAMVDLIAGKKVQGGSTITMQAARNMFLTLDKTFRRKLQETFVTYEMDHEFTKEEIFQLYLNKIFFGQRSYGVAAAAQTYFGKGLDQLTVAEAATLAGIPQAPSLYNPIIHPHLAAARRSYVLQRMLDLRYIDAATAQTANHSPMDASLHAPHVDVDAPYVAELVRQQMEQSYGPAAETAGYRVYTTIDGRLQALANRAVQLGLIQYDRQQGWRGPIGRTVLAAGATPTQLEQLVDEYTPLGMLMPAVVVKVGAQDAGIYIRSRGFADINWSGLSWARKALGEDALSASPKTAADVVAPGDVVYVVADKEGHAQLAQVPQAQSAFVAMDPNDGAIAALVGGFDYFSNKFDRATQAERLPGSGFKPFFYSAALEDGYTPASTLLNAPVVVGGEGLEATWRPENDTRSFSGPVRLRVALAHSLNLVSIRLLRDVGLPYVTQYVSRFGFDPKTIPQNLTLALGTLRATPLQMASAYSVFANGGFKIEPYYIDRVEDASGKAVWQAAPKIACALCANPAALSDPKPAPTAAALLGQDDVLHGSEGPLPPGMLAPQVISAQNDYLMTSMMKDVIRYGTAVKALSLNRDDIAGKTGTSNDYRDAWFNGYTPELEATVWVGYDDDRPLGAGDEGARTALPIWIHFMRYALQGVPQWQRPMPTGIVTLRVSPLTGTLVSDESPDGIPEVFMANHLPTAAPGQGSTAQGTQAQSGAESIF
ncbi:MAG: PBP1A family penicillin-binding protein [Steroidobacteraceae bacterium]